jgi:hypothetical protein
MKDGGDNYVGQRLTGEDDWRIGTDYTKKDQPIFQPISI